MPTRFQLLLSVMVCAAGPPAPEMRVVIEQALDQPTKMTIDDTPLHEAFRIIAEQTGLGVTIGPEALAYLPYGESTRVSVRLENIRLRDGIRAMCNRLGMTYRPAKNGIEIVPSGALERLGRSATWEELGVLSGLMQATWNPGEGDYLNIRSLVRFEGLDGSPEENWSKLSAHLQAALPGPGNEVLTRACAAMGCTWHPWAESIVILPARRQILRQLRRPVSLRFNNRPLANVLRGLARRAGVAIKIDPAAAAELPPKIRQNFSLLAEGVSVAEALEQIGIATGLAYVVSEDTVILRRPAGGRTPSRAGAGAAAGDPIVGKVVVPSADGKYRYEWVIRRSDLSEEQNVEREKLIEQAVKAMREELSNRQ